MAVDHVILTRFGAVFKRSDGQFEGHGSYETVGTDLGERTPQSTTFRALLEAVDGPPPATVSDQHAHPAAAARRDDQRHAVHAYDMTYRYHLEPGYITPPPLGHMATSSYATSLPRCPSRSD